MPSHISAVRQRQPVASIAFSLFGVLAVKVPVVKGVHLHMTKNLLASQQQITANANLIAAQEQNLHWIKHAPNMHHILKSTMVRMGDVLRIFH
jgi:hypothetical protein